MVRVEGFEPSRLKWRRILSPLRLPFRHTRIMVQGVGFEPAIRPLDLMVDHDSTVDNRSTIPAFIK